MKKSFFTLALGFLATGLFSQDLVYTHDANGSRIVRETIVLKPSSHGSSDSSTAANQSPEPQAESYLLGSHILVYPNPTKGLVIVETDENLPQGAVIQVLDSQGRLINRQNVNGNQTEINLSSQPAGMYLLRLVVQGRTNEWRLIKL